MVRSTFHIIAAMFLLCSMPLAAQRVQVVDDNGNAIALAAVRTADGVLLGITGLDGSVADIKGNSTIYVSHLAYKPRTITTSDLQVGVITLEEREYDFEEAEVKPKDYLYSEVYYRFYAYLDDSLRCYRAGIVPCAYDIKKKEQIVKFGDYTYALFNLKSVTWWVAKSDNLIKGGLRSTPGETLIDKSWKKKYQISLKPDGENRWTVANPRETVGTLVHAGGFSTLTLDGARMQMYVNEVNGEERQLKRRQEADYTYSYTEVFRINDDGEINRENFVMSLNHWEHNGSKGREIYIVETTVTGTAYMTKAEFKQKRKELEKLNSTNNMWHMPLADIEAYEREHNITPMTDEVRRAVENITRDKWK